MNRTLTFSLVLLALAAFVGYLTLFTVSQTEQARARIRQAEAHYHRAGAAI